MLQKMAPHNKNETDKSSSDERNNNINRNLQRFLEIQNNTRLNQEQMLLQQQRQRQQQQQQNRRLRLGALRGRSTTFSSTRLIHVVSSMKYVVYFVRTE